MKYRRVIFECIVSSSYSHLVMLLDSDRCRNLFIDSKTDDGYSIFYSICGLQLSIVLTSKVITHEQCLTMKLIIVPIDNNDR